jgi:cystathionine beta-lyase/cystathionine gamma-synthase
MAGAGTKAVHGGEGPEQPTGSVTTPVYRTSTFKFATTEDLLAAARGERPGFYTRYGNPNFAVVEKKFAALHGAEGSVLFGSGMAAIAAVVQTACGTGDRVVAFRDLYGGTRDLLHWLEPKAGIRTTWVALRDHAALARALPGAKLLVAESPTNPMLHVVDLPAVAALCRKAGATFLLDATFAGPVNHRPLEHGVDLVMESATKSLGGHSDLLAGLVAGSADWCRRLAVTRKLVGGISDPDTASRLERSLKTLPVRVKRQNESALELAKRLEGDPRVARVAYPGLPSHPDHALAARLGLGPGSVVTFALKGGAAAARRVADRVRLVLNAPSLGGVESLLSLPVHTSHAMFTPAERAEAGITDDLVRLSVGLEDPADLWADLDRAMAP